MVFRAVFFDLDDTLCDARPAFEAGLAAALAILNERHPNLSDAAMREAWREVHRPLFASLSKKSLSMAEVRDRRFPDLLRRLGIPDDALAAELDIELGRVQLGRLRLFEDAGIVEVFRFRGLHVGIVTNGADDAHPDSQRTKAQALGLTDRVDALWISDATRRRKPDPQAFIPALTRAECRPEEALFVGDSPENDVAGANRAGIASVLLTRQGGIPGLAGDHVPTYAIRSLNELLSLVRTSA